ncbi:MAG: DUF1343 domain-containing protein [Bacteroidales bacterium]|jgi:uncharacterized protein YbbC (DUF1343 family)|nr:DUF1343 domain-containing protein [Bacteroidales bacterium]MDD2264283.1 DUF1343 domain-containing protein [Bacteroidales bacterium]MDD2831517.1 DUF1343 domain-containing protein [Bacteroidales bacterium]MDD3208511.1 DUF1343 domain-containing protein [Bacteroidales bacterium]MDD3697076.1 DUF1343 domain-containing protein [Bacteroidales bacterium]
MKNLFKGSLFLVLLLISVSCKSQETMVKTGIEVLRESGFACLEGKRVGLITNPTGVDRELRSTIDILFQAPHVNLVALYGPEHGVRGDVHAGDHISTQNDPATGLPVYSLYGSTRKPTPEMLQNIDVLVYDIQDIGSRSFTYISTMGLAMEACAELGIEFVVLDRPNPIGGLKVEGCYVEDGCFTFVSQYRIPYVYGLTCGELALLLNGERMLGSGARPGESAQCKLHVVRMEGWTRNMFYDQTGLQWIASSPHIPQAITSFFYPMSGIAGDLGVLSIGVGYTLPFQLFAPVDSNIDPVDLAHNLNDLKLPGLIFRPIYFRPFYSRGQGTTLAGVQVHIMDPVAAPLTDVNFYVIQEIHKLDPAVVFDLDRITRVVGSPFITSKFAERYLFEDIRDYWHKDVETFREISRRYYLY